MPVGVLKDSASQVKAQRRKGREGGRVTRYEAGVRWEEEDEQRTAEGGGGGGRGGEEVKEKCEQGGEGTSTDTEEQACKHHERYLIAWLHRSATKMVPSLRQVTP